jgi:hypothetical protein
VEHLAAERPGTPTPGLLRLRRRRDGIAAALGDPPLSCPVLGIPERRPAGGTCVWLGAWDPYCIATRCLVRHARSQVTVGAPSCDTGMVSRRGLRVVLHRPRAPRLGNAARCSGGQGWRVRHHGATPKAQLRP